MLLGCFQVNSGVVLPDKASLYLTAIEDAEYKEDKIECKLIDSTARPAIHADSLLVSHFRIFGFMPAQLASDHFVGWASNTFFLSSLSS